MTKKEEQLREELRIEINRQSDIFNKQSEIDEKERGVKYLWPNAVRDIRNGLTKDIKEYFEKLTNHKS